MGQAALRLRLLCQLRARPEGGRPDGRARSRAWGGRAGGGGTLQFREHPPRQPQRGPGARHQGATELAFVIDAAGQIAERLMDWTMLEADEELRAWLAAWTGDGGDA